MELEEYKRQRRNSRAIPREIVERWTSRIEARGLQALGREGARQYLSDYGRGIGQDKVINFARQAEASGFPGVADGFWVRAHELEYGVVPTETARPSIHFNTLAPVLPVSPSKPTLAGLPASLQPGHLQTMQPVDAPELHTHYAENYLYWGQPKRDGNRLVITATNGGGAFEKEPAVYYQSRSLELREAPDQVMDAALKATTTALGTFILDGELYYRSVTGSEHRTGAQAATVNLKQGVKDVHPQPIYAIFKALYFQEQDLRQGFETERLNAAEAIAAPLPESHFELLYTARTTEEKLDLIETQKAEGREGEVWINYKAPYIGGKNESSTAMVRTKYTDVVEVVVTALTESRTATRPFKAAVVSLLQSDGTLKPVGNVGTGFDQAQMLTLLKKHALNPGTVKIRVVTQGYTEKGMLWHPRFQSFLED